MGHTSWFLDKGGRAALAAGVQHLEDLPHNYLAQWWEHSTPSNSLQDQTKPTSLPCNRRFLLKDGTNPTFLWYLHTDMSRKKCVPSSCSPVKVCLFP